MTNGAPASLKAGVAVARDGRDVWSVPLEQLRSAAMATPIAEVSSSEAVRVYVLRCIDGCFDPGNDRPKSGRSLSACIRNDGTKSATLTMTNLNGSNSVANVTIVVDRLKNRNDGS